VQPQYEMRPWRIGLFGDHVGYSRALAGSVAPMKLVVAGINHRKVSVQLREKVAFRSEDVPAALSEVQARGAKGALILSTCNRVEVAAALEDEVPSEMLFDFILWNRHGLTMEALRPHFYLLEEREAIRHLFRVAASLDSMIVGEPQILGQLKRAYVQARDQGAMGGALDAVLTRAFTVGKRIRSDTAIGQSAVSVGHVAVELAREVFDTLQKKCVLIIGAGKMSEVAARHLLRGGAAEILIANRTQARAEQIASAFGGQVVPYDLLPQRLAQADIVIASSADPEFVLTPDVVRPAIEQRRHQPMCFIDIGVPRNIDPNVSKFEHVFLYDIDDLQRLAERNLRMRREVAEQAENIVAEEAARFEARVKERDVAPTIVSLQDQFETIRSEVLARYRPKLGSLTHDQEEALEALTRAMVNKIAHGPISEIRRHAGARNGQRENHERELISTVRRIFRLDNGVGRCQSLIPGSV
jgi:glutamyl-tRNA reductase